MAGFQSEIRRFNSLPSTNAESARQAMKGAPEGLCIVAREQTAGRGRLHRKWISPAGAGIYFSMVLRPRLHQSAWSLIPLMAALAVHDALREACALKTDIKWPNDLLANERKLCGVLAETIETNAGRAVILGIGINLTSKAFPLELRDIATSVEAITGKTPDSEVVLQTLVAKLAYRYELLNSADGPTRIIRAWTERSSYANGKRVRVSNGGESFEGWTCGLESDGALRVETHTGETKIVRAADVSALRGMRDEGWGRSRYLSPW